MEFQQSQKLESQILEMEFLTLEFLIKRKRKGKNRIIKTHSTTNTEGDSSSYQNKNYQQQN